MSNVHNSSNRPRLSVAMIVRDAADVLAETLDCVRAIADEIVVADLESTDGSYEIAQAGADVTVQVEWQDSFAAARNACLGRITGDWVLWLEADEWIDEVAAQQLRAFVDESADLQKVYLLFVQRQATSAANCREQIGQVRLLPNNAELRFVGRVREQIIPAVKSAGLGIDALDCIIHRCQRDDEVVRSRADARRRLNLANLTITEDGASAAALLARAEALAELKRVKDAAAAYGRAIAAAQQGSPEMLEAYYGLLTTMDSEAGAADRQIATCLQALENYPLDAQLLCGMGSYLLRAQRLDLAARSYETAATHGQIDPTIWHLADLADVAVTCWSLVLQLEGDAARAEAVLLQAVQERPESERIRRQLIDLFVKAGREDEAITHVKLLSPEVAYRRELPGVIHGAVQLVAGKQESAAESLQRAYNAGCRDVLCLRWLASAQLALGNLPAVEAIVDEWERQEPANLEVVAFRRAVEQRKKVGDSPSCDRARRIDSPSPMGLPSSGPTSVSGPMARPVELF